MVPSSSRPPATMISARCCVMRAALLRSAIVISASEPLNCVNSRKLITASRNVLPIAKIVPEVPVTLSQRQSCNSRAGRSTAARISNCVSRTAFAPGGSDLKKRSVRPTAPNRIECNRSGRPSRKIEISVEPPPISILSAVAPLALQPCDAARPINRASSMPESISTLIPVFCSTALIKFAELLASRTAAVAVATIRSAPRASAIDRKR